MAVVLVLFGPRVNVYGQEGIVEAGGTTLEQTGQPQSLLLDLDFASLKTAWHNDIPHCEDLVTYIPGLVRTASHEGCDHEGEGGYTPGPCEYGNSNPDCPAPPCDHGPSCTVIYITQFEPDNGPTGTVLNISWHASEALYLVCSWGGSCGMDQYGNGSDSILITSTSSPQEYRVRAHGQWGYVDAARNFIVTGIGKRLLTVNKSGSGTVTSSPSGINCGATCSYEFDYGDSVTLTASAASGWSFSGWNGCDSTPNGLCTVNMSNARTVTASFLQQAPPQPSGLNCSDVTQTQIKLNWTDNSNNEDGFRIERKTTGDWSEIATVGANVTSYTNTGLTAGTSYEYRVRSYNGGGHSSYTNTATCSTLNNAPAKPTGLSASVPGAPDGITKINLSWTAPSGPVDGYKVYRSTTNNFTPSGSNHLGNTGSVSYNDSGLSANTTYYYKVIAYNNGGDSPASDQESATTLPNPPTAPSGLGASTVSQTQINLSWTDNSNNETGFKIERHQGDNQWSVIHTTGANATSYSNTGLTANTTYHYRVRATNTGGDSGNSNEASATTLPNAPAAPGAPSSALSCTGTPPANPQIAVSWSSVTGATGYKVFRSVNGGAFAFYQDVGNVTSYTDTSLTYNSTYAYTVSAYNAGGESGQSGASPTRTANCDATVTVTANRTATGTAWNLTEAGNQNGATANQTYTYTVRPASAGSIYTLGSIQSSGYDVSYRLNGGSSVGCSTNSACAVTIEPGNTLNYTITYLLAPSVSASVLQGSCQQADVVLTDRSTSETQFVLYRDTDTNFANGATLIQTIPSLTPGTTGTTYPYNDQYEEEEIFGTSGNFYYHAKAVRSSDGIESPEVATSNQINVVVCPPTIFPEIQISHVTREGSTFGYTPSTRVRNGDLLTILIPVRNLNLATAENISAATSLTDNLKLAIDLGASVVQLSTNGGAYANLNYTATASGFDVSLGSLSNGVKTVKFMARVQSTVTSGSFDRINASGIVDYEYQGEPQPSEAYTLGNLLIYLQLSQPVQFQEGTPR